MWFPHHICVLWSCENSLSVVQKHPCYDKISKLHWLFLVLGPVKAIRSFTLTNNLYFSKKKEVKLILCSHCSRTWSSLCEVCVCSRSHTVPLEYLNIYYVPGSVVYFRGEMMNNANKGPMELNNLLSFNIYHSHLIHLPMIQ